jgi:hypothetical protein
MTEPERGAAELGDKEVELEQLLAEHLARFHTDPQIASLDIDEAIAAVREALHAGRPRSPGRRC